ncbi:MAG: tetratricopeptide repeat protein, partial [Bacteroidia bacterium]|nr:tetratricopeptide repeat protein [Bacteroidia bacterium]
MMKRFTVILLALTLSAGLQAQTDRSEVRAGNRKFRKGDYKNAEIDYRKALVKDSLSVAGCYNLASTLYRMEDWDGAQKALEPVKESISGTPDEAAYRYNAGDVALQKKDYAAAAEAFKQSLLKNPGDLDAKENYIYAKLMMQNQQNGGGQNNQDQNQDQD